MLKTTTIFEFTRVQLTDRRFKKAELKMSVGPTADLRHFPTSKRLQLEVRLKDAEAATLNRRRIMSWHLESGAPGHSLHGASGTLAWAFEVFP